jgi:hypothetical protein
MFPNGATIRPAYTVAGWWVLRRHGYTLSAPASERLCEAGVAVLPDRRLERPSKLDLSSTEAGILVAMPPLGNSIWTSDVLILEV